MLQLQTFTFNPFQENTYVIINDKKQCWIIDPGMYDSSETKHFTDFLDQNQLKPQAIINTHTHIDHIFGVDALVKKYNIPFLIHLKDLPVLQGAAAAAMMFGITLPAVPVATGYIREGEDILLGSDDRLQVRFTPGHSPGSVVFYYPEGQWLIGGDVLFNGSIGRTDLPGGDFDTLISSIKTQLFTLPGVTVVYPGHGPGTTIGYEKQHNPFLK